MARTKRPSERSLLENIRATAGLLPEAEIRTRLGRFLFRQDRSLLAVAHLSGGERMRAGLASLLIRSEPPQLLLLDEPTNDLDLDSVGRLEEALCLYRGALVVASHDDRFLEANGASRRLELPGAPRALGSGRLISS